MKKAGHPRTAMAADHFIAMMAAGVLETRKEADRFTAESMIGVIETPIIDKTYYGDSDDETDTYSSSNSEEFCVADAVGAPEPPGIGGCLRW